MNLSNLKKTSQKSYKRIGRGHGSGRGGHTSTRGSKGQNSRTSVGLFFEGTKVKKSLLKRLPLFRGKGKFKSFKKPSYVINLKYLTTFTAGEEVTLESLRVKGIISKNLPNDAQIKILGDGDINVPLTFFLQVSKKALEKIEKAGGKIVSTAKKGLKDQKAETPEPSEKKVIKEEEKPEKKAKITKKVVSKVSKKEPAEEKISG